MCFMVSLELLQRLADCLGLKRRVLLPKIPIERDVLRVGPNRLRLRFGEPRDRVVPADRMTGRQSIGVKRPNGGAKTRRVGGLEAIDVGAEYVGYDLEYFRVLGCAAGRVNRVDVHAEPTGMVGHRHHLRLDHGSNAGRGVCRREIASVN